MSSITRRMEPLPRADYRILVGRGWEYPSATLHACSMREPILTIFVPLAWGEKEVPLSAGELLADLYDRARYDLRIDCGTAPPEPALSEEDAAWVEVLLREKGLRG